MKNRKIVVTISMCLISYICVSQNSSLEINYSGAKDFIKLVEKSKIDTSDINNLLDSEPYEKLFSWSTSSIQLDKQDFKNIFYHSLLGLNLDEKYQTNDFVGSLISRIIGHIKDAKQYPSLVNNKIEFLKEELNFDSIINKTYTFCPNKEIIADYNVYFIIGLGQGIGPDGFIMIEIMQIEENDEIKWIEDWISHELFHNYHAYIPNKKIDDEKYITLDNILGNFQEEGIGELLMQPDEKLSDLNIEEANAFLMRFNYKLNIAFQKEDKELFDKLFNTISSETSHSVGLMMAYVIKQQFGKEVLVECVGDKKKFFLTYNDAAKKINQPDTIFIFDEAVINSVSNLEWKLMEPKY